MSMLYENSEYDNQFTSAIKVIQTAFFNQSIYFKAELSGLSNEIMMKNSKIIELEQSNSSLFTEKEEYQKTMQNLISENSRLVQIIERGKSAERLPHKASDLDAENKTIELNNFSSLLESTKATLKKNRSESMVLKPKSIHSQAQAHSNTSENGNGIGNELQLDNIGSIPKIKKSARTTSGVPVSIATDFDRIRTTHRTFRDRENREENFKTQPMLETGRGTAKEYISNDNLENIKINHNNKRKGNFFKKCRSIMSSKDYSQMIEVVRLANSYQITKQETYDRISYLLGKKYPSFVREFEELLFPSEN